MVLTLGHLHGFAGRIKPAKEIVRVYAQDRTNRTISFMALANLSPGTNDYLAKDVLKNIALILSGTKTLQLASDDLALSLMNASYEPYLFTNRFVRSVATDTNLFLSDLFTNNRYAFCYTNSSRGAPVSVIASLQRSNTFYIDPMIAGTNGGFSLTNLRPGEFLLTNRTVSNLPPLMVFAESNGYVRTLEVVNQIWEGKNIAVGDVLAMNGSDYLVTGDMKALPENHLLLSLYLFNQRKGWVKQIFKKDLVPERWYEETATVPQIILAEIQGRDIATNITFTSSPPGAFVYFNEQYIGATPFTLVAWPAGDYRVRLWHANGFFDGAGTREYLSTNFATPSAWVFSNRHELTSIHLEKKFSGTTQHALFLRDNRAGTFRLAVKGPPADLYLNSQLIAVRTNAWEDRLETGSYFLELRVPKKAPENGTNGLTNLAALATLTNQSPRPNDARVSNQSAVEEGPLYGKKLIRLQIKHEALTDLSVLLKPLPPPSPLGRFLFDHYRNTKIFLILTMTLTAAGSYAFYRYLSYDDKFRAASAQGSGAASFYNSQANYWRYWALGVGGGAAGAGILTLISRILDVTSTEIRIETDYNHSPDVQFRYHYSTKF